MGPQAVSERRQVTSPTFNGGDTVATRLPLPLPPARTGTPGSCRSRFTLALAVGAGCPPSRDSAGGGRMAAGNTNGAGVAGACPAHALGPPPAPDPLHPCGPQPPNPTP